MSYGKHSSVLLKVRKSIPTDLVSDLFSPWRQTPGFPEVHKSCWKRAWTHHKWSFLTAVNQGLHLCAGPEEADRTLEFMKPFLMKNLPWHCLSKQDQFRVKLLDSNCQNIWRFFWCPCSLLVPRPKLQCSPTSTAALSWPSHWSQAWHQGMFSSCPENPSSGFWTWLLSASCFAENEMAQMPLSTDLVFNLCCIMTLFKSVLASALIWHSSAGSEAQRGRSHLLSYDFSYSALYILRGFCESPQGMFCLEMFFLHSGYE